ncbi:MAG TPA: hypothetical protein VHE55_14295 [Fimbriimonadaceae bacterium]|nr:hypothetical protein [Fimbriimonadaceae bacterium]
MTYNVVTCLDISKVFWIALTTSGLMAYPIWRLLIVLKSRQTISQYAPEGHQVKQGTPTMGGLIIAVGVLLAYLAVGAGLGGIQSDLPVPRLPNLGWIAAFLFAGFSLIGFVDDFVVPRLIKGKRGLGWKQKIVMQLVFAGIAAFAVTGWKWHIFVAVAVFLILFFSNAYNFADGLDGLAGTILLGIASGFAILGWFSGNAYLTLLMVPLCGAAIPFLYLNAPPAKVFMGDVGSLPIGAVLGLAASALVYSPSLYGTPSNGFEQSGTMFVATKGLPGHLDGTMLGIVLIASLVMIAELVPVPLQILSVKLFKRKLFPYTPIHHAFEKAGWKETRVVGMFALTQLVISALAVTILLQFMASNFSQRPDPVARVERPVGR